MRQIKFRGKRIDNGEWIEGYYGESFREISSDIKTSYIVEMNRRPKGHDIHKKTLGQFTGLTDKNGKEIYEGDIVKITYCPLGSNPNVIEYYNIGVVEFKIKTFGVTLKREGTLILDEERSLSHHKTEETTYIHPTAGKNWFNESLKFSKCEIIGNEFDNPELLNPQ